MHIYVGIELHFVFRLQKAGFLASLEQSGLLVVFGYCFFIVVLIIFLVAVVKMNIVNDRSKSC